MYSDVSGKKSSGISIIILQRSEFEARVACKCIQLHLIEF